MARIQELSWGVDLTDNDPLRRFHNDLIDLILRHKPTKSNLMQLAERCEVECPAGDTKDALYQIIGQARRDEEIRARLLEEAPNVFPKITGELVRLITSHPDAGIPVPEVENSEAVDSEAVEDVIARVRLAGALRGKFRDVLFEEEQVDRLHVPDLHEQLLVALNDITGGREILMNRSGNLSVQVRRLVSAVVRVEDDIESCLDALIYFAHVSRSTEAARRAASSVGVTDTDRATAELVRLRELNYCREQVRYRLNRLSEDCDRVRAE